MTYAGFWIRLAAYLIDGCILSFAAMILLMPFGGLLAILHIGGDEVLRNPFVLLSAGLIIASLIAAGVVGKWLYFAWFESSIWQATPGKRALNLFVTDESGQRISFARGSGRFLGRGLNALTMNIGYLLVAFSARKQGLHDIVASTLVMRRVTQVIVAPGSPAPGR